MVEIHLFLQVFYKVQFGPNDVLLLHLYWHSVSKRELEQP